MNECCDFVCFRSRGDRGRACDCCHPVCPRPLSVLTPILIVLQLIFIGLTIGYMVSEYRSEAFKTLNCPARMLAHPIIVLAVSAISVLTSILVFCFYNKGLDQPAVKRPNAFYLRRTSQLLCYNVPMCFLYLLIPAFVVFIIVGQLFLFANTPLGCVKAFEKTIAFDYTLVGIFLSIVLFGVFFLCCTINVNSRDGFDCLVMTKFFANIVTFGSLFKSEFQFDKQSEVDARVPPPQQEFAMVSGPTGPLSANHYYDPPAEQLTLQNREEVLARGIIGQIRGLFKS